MNMYKYSLFILIILSVSCRNRSTDTSKFSQGQIDSLCLDSTKLIQIDDQAATVIDLNPFLKKKSFDFGENVKEVHFVPLETRDESLVANIYKIIVTDSMIYIMDNYKRGGVVIFDKEGKFIKRITPGRGPGELYRLYNIAYDKQNNKLLAYQHPFLLIYTPIGNYIRQIRLPFGFYNFGVTPEGYIFKTFDKYGNEHLGTKKDYTLLVSDKNFRLEYAGIPNPFEMSTGGYSYLYSNDGEISITQNYNDTIYRYISRENKLKAKYVMDYHSKQLPDRYLKATRHDLQNVLDQNNYYYFIGEYLETTFHHAFFLRNDYLGLRTVIYRDKRTGGLMGGTNAEYNVNEILTMAFPKSTFGSHFISVHYPNPNDSLLLNSSIITYQDKQKLKGRKEDDNPMLVFYQLKEI